MKKSGFHKTVGCLMLMVLALPVARGSAAPARDEVAGDWQITVDFNGRQMASMVSLSRDNEGELTGQWISLRGVSELSNIKHEGHKLSFTQVNRFRERESTSDFVGTIERRTLSGILSNERGESKVEGRRVRRMPRVVGEWATTLKVDEREYAATLVVKAGKKGQFTADWRSQWGEHEITDVRFKSGTLTFKRKSKVQDRQWESTFEGTVKGHALSGTVTSEQGNSIALQGKRVGAALVGVWGLEATSDSGSRPQILRVNPDLSGTYGPIVIDKIDLEGSRVSFTTALEFGDQRFDIRFAGTLEGNKLRGELTNPRGSRTVEGLKRGRKEAPKPSRKPDVVFVPTPQEVVEKMLELAQVKKDDLVYDLGCGDGRIVVTAAKIYGCKGVGYDISPKRVRESLANVKEKDVGDLVTIEHKDIFTLDLSKANVITLYLLPSLNVKLIPQLEKLKPGSRIVSHDFDMKGVEPDEVVTVTSDDSYEEHTIYLWTTPLRKEGASDR